MLVAGEGQGEGEYMRIQIFTKPTVRLAISIFYLGSLAAFVTYLGMTGVSNLSWLEIALVTTSTATWAAAGMLGMYRRISAKVWEYKHENVDDEITPIRPSTHSTVNAALNIASSVSSLGFMFCKAPDFSMVDYLRITGYGLWFSTAATNLVLARTVELKRDNNPKAKVRLCGLRPEAIVIFSESQIETSGGFLGAAIWLDTTLYPVRAAGNISWLTGASVALTLAIYEYVVASREVEPEASLDEVRVEEVTEDNSATSSYSTSLTPS